MKKTLRRKVRLGRFGLPMWMLGLVVLLVAGAAAGQAVGPVLSGAVTGSAGLTVEQSVVLDATSTATTVTGGHSGAIDDFVVTTNDEGTGFTAAIELHVGDKATLKLDVDNLSDALANAVLELNVPRGVDVEVDSSGGDLKEAQLTRNSWLMTVAVGSEETLNIDIESKDDLMPGFYTITGRIVQVAN